MVINLLGYLNNDLLKTKSLGLTSYSLINRMPSESAYIRQVNLYSFYIPLWEGDGLHEGDG